MRFRVSARFQKMHKTLPREIQQRTKEKLKMFQTDPSHPGLHFKKVSKRQPIWSLRINQRYRMLGYRDDDGMLWDWIGMHDEYERMIGRYQ